MGEGKTPSNFGRGRDLTACLVGLRSQSGLSGPLLDKDGSQVLRLDLGLLDLAT